MESETIPTAAEAKKMSRANQQALYSEIVARARGTISQAIFDGKIEAKLYAVKQDEANFIMKYLRDLGYFVDYECHRDTSNITYTIIISWSR